MNKENNIKIGPVTGNLLQALKHIESARELYFEAMGKLRGTPDDDNYMTVEETAAFDKVRDLVEDMIGDNIRTWANSTRPNDDV